MGINGIGAMGSASARQMASVQPADFVSKSIQNEISNVQRQKQGLSSKGDISAGEKQKKRQELQQELSSLNTKLRMRQDNVQKEQKKEDVPDEIRLAAEEEKIAENKDTDTDEMQSQDSSVQKMQNIEIDLGDKGKKEADADAPLRETKAVISGDSGLEQAKQHRRVIVRMKDAIAVLKGEIRQDEARGTDVEHKKAELEKQEEKMNKASDSQFSVLGEVNSTMKEARQDKVKELQGGTKPTAGKRSEDQALIKAVNFSKEQNNDANQAVQFFVR